MIFMLMMFLQDQQHVKPGELSDAHIRETEKALRSALQRLGYYNSWVPF